MKKFNLTDLISSTGTVKKIEGSISKEVVKNNDLDISFKLNSARSETSTVKLLDTLSNDSNIDVLMAVASNLRTNDKTLDKLAKLDNKELNKEILKNRNIDSMTYEYIVRLADNDDKDLLEVAEENEIVYKNNNKIFNKIKQKQNKTTTVIKAKPITINQYLSTENSKVA